MAPIKHYELRADRQIALLSKYKSLQSEALKLVDYEISRSKVERLPLDIDGFRNYLKVKDIRLAQLQWGMKGRTVNEGDFFIIEISKSLKDKFKRKVTVLHEIAHIILEDELAAKINLERANIKRFSKSLKPQVIEKLCDAAAEEMLLPKRALREELRSIKPSLKHLHKIAQKYNYPVEFIAKRISDTALWEFRLLWWKIVDGKAVAFKSSPPVDELTLAEITLGGQTTSIIMQSHALNGFFEGKEKLVVGNLENVYKVQAMPEEKGAIICMLTYQPY
jgi:Zn-dependent peptidase ImmA (M78 family)